MNKFNVSCFIIMVGVVFLGSFFGNYIENKYVGITYAFGTDPASSGGGFTITADTSGDAGRLILDALGKLGTGGLFNSDGTPMTEEQLLAAIEAYVESAAGRI